MSKSVDFWWGIPPAVRCFLQSILGLKWCCANCISRGLIWQRVCYLTLSQRMVQDICMLETLRDCGVENWTIIDQNCFGLCQLLCVNTGPIIGRASHPPHPVCNDEALWVICIQTSVASRPGSWPGHIRCDLPTYHRGRFRQWHALTHVLKTHL